MADHNTDQCIGIFMSIYNIVIGIVFTKCLTPINMRTSDENTNL